jgi:hypothetical protein
MLKVMIATRVRISVVATKHMVTTIFRMSDAETLWIVDVRIERGPLLQEAGMKIPRI